MEGNVKHGKEPFKLSLCKHIFDVILQQGTAADGP